MDDPFAQFGPIGSADAVNPPQPPPEPAPPPVPTVQTASGTEPGPNPNDPFAKFGDFVEPPTTITGTIMHSVERGVAPMVGSLPAAGAGARVGAVLGAGIPGLGETGIGEAGGALVGGIAGMWMGADAVAKAQQYAISSLPLWAQQAIGQDAQQQAAEDQQHPIASFIGDLAPQALVMSPRAGVNAIEAIGSSSWQKLMANPVTARIMSGAFMAGNEAIQEKMQGQPLDPLRIGIATGIGMIWARQNALGNALSNWGEHVVGWRATTAPTPADMADAKVAGPGITEKVFHGEEAPAPKAASEAIADAQLQKMAEPPKPELPKPYEAPADHAPAIANDVATQLIKAGRPIEEALAAGDLIASHYEARATRFAGGIGDPLDIYNREGAFIRNAGQRGAPPSMLVPPSEPPPRPLSAEEPSPFIYSLLHPDTLEALKGGPAPQARELAQSAPKNETTAGQEPEFDWTPGGGSKTAKVGDTSIDYGISRDGQTADVILLKTPKAQREQGSARAAMDSFLKKADGNGTTVFLTPEPMDKGVSKTRLKDFYKSLGFVDNTGKNKDFRSTAAMVRLPKTPTELNQSARGKIKLQEGKRPIITLMRDANASTFLHESGHQWLEELARDAAHPSAPADLKADHQTVRDWLGSTGEKTFTTKQHEKFARAFEQYLREGKAPTSRLATVFEKFKNWLTTIYQSLKGLGAPINDDIRGVFDRLIAARPERKIGASDATGGPTLTDIHRADAAHTEPAEAEPAGDRVVAETTRSEQDDSPHVQAEIAASDARAAATTGTDTGGEAGNGAGGSGTLDTNSQRPAGQPGDSANRGATGNQQPVGGNAVSEGNGSSGGATSQPISPHEPFVPNDPHIDKAGNIRLDTLTTNDDVKAAIRESAQANDEFIAARRGVITDGMVMDLADALGMDYRQLSERKLGQAFNAEQVMAARKLLIESATTVHDLMKKAATGTDQDVIAYAEARDRHQMIQSQVAGITAEAGRALRAFRNITSEQSIQNVDVFLKGATGKTLYQLKQEAILGAQLATAQQVSKFMDDAAKRSFGRMVLEYWINGLISGPTTHITYMVGNTILAAEKVGPETALAAAIGSVRARLGRGGERVRMGEIAAQLRGLKTGLPSSIKSAIDSFAEGTTTLLPTEKPRDLIYQTGTPAKQSYLQEGATYHDAIGAAFSLVRGIRDGILAGAKELEAGGEQGAPLLGAKYSTLGALPDIAVKGVSVLPVGTATRLPGRFVASIHSFFRAANYSMEKAALAYRQASEEGLTGTAFDARIADLHMNPPEPLMEQARKTATDLTLMSRAGPLTETVSRFFNHEFKLPFLGPTPLLKFINPFMHIGANIINQSIVQRTPVGLLHPQIRADLSGVNGNIAADHTAARMMAGTGLSIMFGSLAAEGYVSGSGPDDPKKRAMWLLAGNQPHSVRIGDTWYQMNRLGPMGMLASISADMYEVAHYASQDDMQQAGAALQMAFTQTIMDEGWMKGPSDFLRAVENRDGYRQIYLRDFLSSFVPYSVGSFQIARAMDPYARQAKTLVDAIKQKIPGISESLMPRRDIWGEPIANKDALGAPGVTAIYEQQVSRDPVNQTLWNLGIYPSQPEKRIRNVDLTPAQYDEYSAKAGRMAKMALDRIVTTGQFQSLPDYAKVDIVNRTIEMSRETARGQLMMKYPEILRQSLSAKTAKYLQ